MEGKSLCITLEIDEQLNSMPIKTTSIMHSLIVEISLTTRNITGLNTVKDI